MLQCSATFFSPLESRVIEEVWLVSFGIMVDHLRPMGPGRILHCIAVTVGTM